MSREDVFSGLEDVLEPEEREAYVAGANVDEGLVRTILELLFEKPLVKSIAEMRDSKPVHEERVERMTTLLEPYEIENGAALVEGVLLGTRRYLEDMPCGRMNNILIPLMQVLYNRGHNDFFVDYNLLEKPEVEFDPTSHLEGTPENPLRATLARPGKAWFGYRARHCKLKLIGNTEYVGPKAYHTEFIIKGSAEYIGFEAESCTIYLDELVSNYGSLPTGFPPQSCVVYMDEEPESTWSLMRQDFWFYSRSPWKNTLYVYDGEEEKRFLWKTWTQTRWKEVTREE